jgi:hypothetical protein
VVTLPDFLKNCAEAVIESLGHWAFLHNAIPRIAPRHKSEFAQRPSSTKSDALRQLAFDNDNSES